VLERKAEFSPDPVSVADARRFVRQTLVDWDAEAFEYQVSALVTELATNSILHARTSFVVELSYSGHQLRLSVTDGSSRAPLRKSHSPEATTGRGLELVRALSDSWGVDRQARGKTVWCNIGTDAARSTVGTDAGASPPLDSAGAITTGAGRRGRGRSTIGDGGAQLVA
jgi:anti-sigma regulatory factor (Ser/Thr protein kinase)